MTEVVFPAIVMKSQEKGTASLWLDSPYDELVRAFVIANKVKAGSKIRVTFQPWSGDCSIRARNLFFALRDRLAEATGDTSYDYLITLI